MIELSGPTTVTLYLDAMGLFTALGLTLISRRLNARGNPGDRLFFDMCVSVMLYAVFNGTAYIFTEPEFIVYPLISVILRTVGIACLLVFSFQWLLYVDFMIYGSRDYLFRIYKKHAIPLAFALIILVINIFTGIAFEPLPGGLFDDRLLYNALVLLIGIYFAGSLVMAYRYNRQIKRLHFFHAKPMIVPFVAGLLFTVLTPFSASPMGCAVGLAYVYFSLVERWRYEDRATGFYNHTYVDEILKMTGTGKVEYRSALLLEARQSAGALSDMLTQLLPRDGEVIRLSENSFLLILENGDKALLSWLDGRIGILSGKYDSLNPDIGIGLKITSFTREKGESSKDFIIRVAAD